jgi:integrase
MNAKEQSMTKKTAPRTAPTLYDKKTGMRKYLTLSEVKRFLNAADNLKPRQRTLCYIYAETGVRLNEALDLVNGSIDVDKQLIVVRTLKQHDPTNGDKFNDRYREIPISSKLLDMLRMVHEFQYGRRDAYLWSRDFYRSIKLSDTIAATWVKDAMISAGIEPGPHRCIKGLRHAFGVTQVTHARAPLTQVQKWMGHTNMQTTAIYTLASGGEERLIAERYFDTLHGV